MLRKHVTPYLSSLLLGPPFPSYSLSSLPEGSWGSLNIDRKKGVHLSSKQGSELQLDGADPETAIGLIDVDNLTG